MSEQQPYSGRRILEAMHSAVRYGEAVFAKVCTAMPPGSARVLDFGAGDGFFVKKFQERHVRVDCVEPDADLRAQLKGSAAHVYADIAEVASATIDFVYSINVLEHITQVDRIAAELHRVLRPSGRLFVFVPAFELLWTSLDDEVGHVRRFSRSSLRAVIENAGMIVEDIRCFDSAGFAAALAVRGLEKLNMFRYGAESVSFYDRCVFPVSQTLDHALHRVLGKNLIAVACVPSAAAGAVTLPGGTAR